MRLGPSVRDRARVNRARIGGRCAAARSYASCLVQSALGASAVGYLIDQAPHGPCNRPLPRSANSSLRLRVLCFLLPAWACPLHIMERSTT